MSPRLASWRITSPIFDDRGLDPLGGFIKDQQLWAAGQRAADRQLLLLAAG